MRPRARCVLKPETFQCIYLSRGDDWDGFRRSPQHLCSGLAARGHRVVYFESPIFLQSLVDSPLDQLHSPALRRRWKVLLNGGFTPEPDVRVCAFLTRILPVKTRLDSLARIDLGLTRALLRHEAKGRLDPRAPRTVWFTYPDQLPYGAAFSGATVVYWVYDDYLHYGMSVSHSDRPTLERRHRDLLRRADLVLCTSSRLAEAYRAESEHVAVVDNGVDWEAFACAPAYPPPELAGLPRPILGYTGVLDAPKIDIAFQLALCDAHPEWSIVSVGRASDFAGRPECRRPNLHFVGPVPFARVPSFVREFDLCLMPHRRTPLTEAMSPLKLKEYLAAGRAVVTRDLPWIGGARSLVYPAETAAEFVAQSERALREDGPVRQAARREWARREDWRFKVAEVEAHVAAAVDRRLAGVQARRVPAEEWMS